MKFRCLCDTVIYDQTDNIPWKAFYIAEEDEADMLAEMDAAMDSYLQAIADPAMYERWHQQIYPVEAGFRDPPRVLLTSILWDIFGAYNRPFYQCETCGRLWLWDGKFLTAFTPEAPETSTTLLASIKSPPDAEHPSVP
jgi:hypothetical protein